MLRLLARLIGQTLNYFFWQATYWIYIKPFHILNDYMKNKAYFLYHCRRAYQSHISPINSSILFSVYGRLFWGNKAQSFNFLSLHLLQFKSIYWQKFQKVWGDCVLLCLNTSFSCTPKLKPERHFRHLTFIFCEALKRIARNTYTHKYRSN